jgi:hypothetical protein
MNPTDPEPQITSAERYYKNHLQAVNKYQTNHKEERAVIMKKYRERIKNDPVKYAQLLESKRIYYQERKKRDALKEQATASV